MGFRFFRRIKLAPGVHVNFSKSGASLSLGSRGGKITFGPRGTRITTGIPGTGLYHTTVLPKRRASEEKKVLAAFSPPSSAASAPTLGFFQRLFTPPQEIAFVEGMRELVLGREEKALAKLQESLSLPDGALTAGLVALRLKGAKEALPYLERALQLQEGIGKTFAKYGIHPNFTLLFPYGIALTAPADQKGLLLALAQVYEDLGKVAEALTFLEHLANNQPQDELARLCLVHALMHGTPGEEAYRRVLQLTAFLPNETPVHTLLLLYRARALKGLGLLEAAKETLTQALRRKKDRPSELMKALRYERALLYEDMGNPRQARKELEKIYAEDPAYADVAARLGLS
ncbi:MAG: hypothetical protein BLITH_0745 [Brockia lithotrophica]|uniref:DUF4236 domain-containing protein n=1 Tax=Brockia lithotrophica TaxID=933949 RepID=A0A2T5G8R7_9BACL|nr:DUF4236 domain-containing protein [Brockia lithotrophica]PTQ52566.1 MAG: hypothetical protein BLITH_0745 [Brockia lithotrophica]